MKDSSLIRTVLFNILLVLTLLIIYLMFFPKKSYVKEKLDNEPSHEVEEVFNSNINSMKIASLNYFENNDTSNVTLQELIDKNLLTELKDSTNTSCSNDSYVEKRENKLIIALKCSDKEDTKEIVLDKEDNDSEERLLCIYEYKKETKEGYTDWSDWSEWSKEKIEKDELTNVEEKVEKEEDGTEVIENTNEYSIEATYNSKIGCPDGYTETNGTCKKKEETNSINAIVKYTCEGLAGYRLEGSKCVGSTNTLNAIAHYSCPSNQGSLEYELSGTTCRVFMIRYINPGETQGYYTCPDGYYLSGNRCYASETYNEEIKKYKDVTYYRYQKREKTNKKIDIIWSSKDNQELLDKEYTMSRVITCEF
jgi:hypothetical protein